MSAIFFFARLLLLVLPEAHLVVYLATRFFIYVCLPGDSLSKADPMAEVSDVKQSILGNYEMKSWLRLAFFFCGQVGSIRCSARKIIPFNLQN